MKHICQGLPFYCIKEVPENHKHFCHFHQGGETHFLVLAHTLIYRCKALVAQTATAVDFKSGLLSIVACVLSHLGEKPLIRWTDYLLVGRILAYEPKLRWKFGDSSFMRQGLNTQALLSRSPVWKSTLGLALKAKAISVKLWRSGENSEKVLRMFWESPEKVLI